MSLVVETVHNATLESTATAGGSFPVATASSLIILHIGIFSSTPTQCSVVSADFGGASMTLIQAVKGATGASRIAIEHWMIRNPAVGSNSVSITIDSPNASQVGWGWGAMEISGLNNSYPILAAYGFTGTGSDFTASGLDTLQGSTVLAAGCISRRAGNIATYAIHEDASQVEFSSVTFKTAQTVRMVGSYELEPTQVTEAMHWSQAVAGSVGGASVPAWAVSVIVAGDSVTVASVTELFCYGWDQTSNCPQVIQWVVPRRLLNASVPPREHFYTVPDRKRSFTVRRNTKPKGPS